MPDILTLLWRNGRTIGRSIYAILHDEPSKDDIFIGMMDTSELAQRVVDDHNTQIPIRAEMKGLPN